jgi:hypothetical protein
LIGGVCRHRGRFPSRARLHRIARTMRVAAADLPNLPEDPAALRALLLSVIA